jgi:enoyl-CoA hydratase/carnithine racemase
MPSIHLKHDGAVARLLIDHPERRNAFSRAMWRQVPGLVAQALAAGGTRAVTVQSAAPGAFAAGADISEFESTYRTAQESLRANAEIQDAIEALAACPVPTIALIDGPCVGGGVALVLACDIRLASERASFAVTPARLGLSYHPGDVARLVRACGRAGAAELLFGGLAWTAERAARAGLANDVLPTAEFDAGAARLLDAIGANSLESTQALKRALDAAESAPGEATARALAEFEALFASADFREGRDAFLAKRKPSFPSHRPGQDPP